MPLPAYSPELNPVEDIWEYPRASMLANKSTTIGDDIVDKACEAWMVLADDKDRAASIATREWATVNVQGRWDEMS